MTENYRKKNYWNKINIKRQKWKHNNRYFENLKDSNTNTGKLQTEIEETDIITEVREAINKLKIGNSPKIDDITPEINLLNKRMERMNYITLFIRRAIKRL